MTKPKDHDNPKAVHEDVIPVLEDIVGEVDQPVSDPGPGPDPDPDPQHESTTPADLIVETLLDDQWKESYDTLLSAAREKISSARMQWSMDKSEESAQALLDKIHLTFEAQIRETINNSIEKYIDELRESLFKSLQDQIAQIPALLEQKEDDGPEQ
jgi:hypothetical protein